MKRTITSIVLVSLMAMFVNFNAKALGMPLENGTIVGTVGLGFRPGLGGSLGVDYVVVDSWGGRSLRFGSGS